MKIIHNINMVIVSTCASDDSSLPCHYVIVSITKFSNHYHVEISLFHGGITSVQCCS